MSCELEALPDEDSKALTDQELALLMYVGSAIKPEVVEGRCFFCKGPCKGLLQICGECHDRGAALRGES